mmetsp:Transcript_5773/g.17222  ORF Transcript_5773/g.17222 Transcript_5773/m.17222 type:complete len:464 (+) Transcript_5773:84-1475(+)
MAPRFQRPSQTYDLIPGSSEDERETRPKKDRKEKALKDKKSKKHENKEKKREKKEKKEKKERKEDKEEHSREEQDDQIDHASCSPDATANITERAENVERSSDASPDEGNIKGREDGGVESGNQAPAGSSEPADANRGAAEILRARLRGMQNVAASSRAQQQRVQSALEDKFKAHAVKRRAQNLADDAEHASIRAALGEDEYDDLAADENEVGERRKRAKEERYVEKDNKRARSWADAQQKAVDRCRFCLRGRKDGWQSVLSVAKETYLTVPSVPIADGHCLIIPFEHEVSCREAADEVYEETRNYQQALVRMFFESEQKEVIFFETALDVRTGRRHMAINCIPMSRADASEAPIYFKKALMEQGSEWSDNKKIIETGSNGVRNTVPKGFPYFHVEFGLAFGYVHVIDDERSFDRGLAKEVIGSIGDGSPVQDVGRGPGYSADDMSRVEKLRNLYSNYEWVQS